MQDRRQLLWPREDWPLIRRVALTIAGFQLAAFLMVGGVIWCCGSEKPDGIAVSAAAAAQARPLP